MIAQLFSLLYILSICFISGGIILKITKWNLGFFDEFLLGLVFTNAAFTFYSIFSPLNIFSSLTIFLILLLCLISFQKWAYDYFQKKIASISNQIKSHPTFSIFIIICCGIAFFKSLYSPQLHLDASLYHIQSIKWMNEYPTIPGLANIHDRFGFNPNILPMFAATGFSSFFGHPVYAVNLALILMFGCWIFYLAQKAWLNNRYFFLLALIIFFCFFYDFGFKWISTTTTDYGAVFIVIYSMFKFSEIDRNSDLKFLFIILSLYAITLKLSSTPISLLTIFLLFRYKLYEYTRNNILVFFFALFILVPWLIKNVILTGWLIYPFPYVDIFSFDWKVPAESVFHTKETISSWAKIPGANFDVNLLSIREWVTIWLKDQQVQYLALLILSIIVSIVYIIYLSLKNAKVFSLHIALSLVILTGIIFWFLTGPDFRFGISFIIPGLLIPLKITKAGNVILKYISQILMFIFILYFLKSEWFHPWHFIKNFKGNVVIASKIDYSYQNKPVHFGYFIIDQKVRVYYPLIGDLCFDKELPCTPCKMENLHLRGNNISDGFYIKK